MHNQHFYAHDRELLGSQARLVGVACEDLIERLLVIIRVHVDPGSRDSPWCRNESDRAYLLTRLQRCSKLTVSKVEIPRFLGMEQFSKLRQVRLHSLSSFKGRLRTGFVNGVPI